jgi:arsenate reductase
MKKVLFVCVHNAGRSQMAEAIFNTIADGEAVGESAGTKPSERINPTVVRAMLEVGFDLRDRRPKALTIDMMEEADRVITMGCGEDATCPAAMAPTEDWALEDPEGKPIESVRRIRDEIRARVEKLAQEMGVKHKKPQAHVTNKGGIS